MTFYHASLLVHYPGTVLAPGHPANFSDKPMEYVFFCDNEDSAGFWMDFLCGDSMAEKLGYWPDVYLYEVRPTREYEPDPWCEQNDVRGCFMTKHAVIVVGRVA